MEKLGKLSPRNLNKKIKRRDEMNAGMKEETKQLEKEIDLIQAERGNEWKNQAQTYEDIIDEQNEVIIRLNDNLDSVLEAKSKAQKLKWYYKNKAQKYVNQGKEGHLFSKIAELKAKIAELELPGLSLYTILLYRRNTAYEVLYI